MKLEQNVASALLYVSIKQASLKVLRHLALFFRGLKFWYKTGMHPQICLMTFSERKNPNFQSIVKINIIAYFSAQAFLRCQLHVLKYDALTLKHV